MRFWKLTLLGILGICMSLSACTNLSSENIVIETSSQDDEPTIVTFFGYKADSLNLVAIENILRSFMEEHEDVNVCYEGIKGSAYWEALEKRVLTNHMDDIFMNNQDYSHQFMENDYLADLSALSGINGYQDWVLEQITEEDGSIYIAPTCIAAYALYVNEDLLARYGLSAPQNLEEFQTICQMFADEGIVPIIANSTYSLRTLILAYCLYPYYQDDSFDMTTFNTDPQALANVLAPGLDWIEEMKENGWIDPAEIVQTGATSDDLNLFAENERPFMITGAWASLRLQEIADDFTFSIQCYPVSVDGLVLCADVNTPLSVNANSENLDEALELVDYFLQEDVMWEYANSQSSFLPLKNQKQPKDEAVSSLYAQYIKEDPVLVADYRLVYPMTTIVSDVVDEMMLGMSADEAKVMLLEKLQEYSQ